MSRIHPAEHWGPKSETGADRPSVGKPQSGVAAFIEGHKREAAKAALVIVTGLFIDRLGSPKG